MTKGSALDEAIASIDALIDNLQNGKLLGKAPSSIPASTTAHLPARSAHGQPGGAVLKTQKSAPKEKSAKSATKLGGGGASAAAEGPELLAKAHLAVAVVTSVEPHPDSDKLYITKLDIGGGVQRQVIAGLQKFVSQDALQGSKVVTVLNLKPAKLAGMLSEGMILAAASSPGVPSQGEDGAHVMHVVPLLPDAAAEPGDLLHIQDQEAPVDASGFPKQLKGDHWRKIVAELRVKDGGACFCGTPLVTGRGKVLAPGMPDGSTIS